MSDSFDIGDVVTLNFTVRDLSGTLVDPGTITLTVLSPDATTTVLTPLRDSIGTYHYNYVPASAGTFIYRWATTGTGQAAEEGSFLVRTMFDASSLFKPNLTDVHALIAQRPAFTDTSKPSIAEVQKLIAQRTADVLGELDGLAIPPSLFGLAQRTIALGVAADVESGYFPEQQLGDSQHASLTARYLQALTRFQQLLTAQGGGPVRAGSMRSTSSTRAAYTEQAAALGLATPAIWAGYGYDSGYGY